MNLVDSCKAILKEHGEHCETYKLASSYHGELTRLAAELEQATGNLTEEEYADAVDDLERDYEDEIERMATEYERELLEEYSLILQHEYEYLLSDEAVAESIIINEYKFTEDGERA